MNRKGIGTLGILLVAAVIVGGAAAGGYVITTNGEINGPVNGYDESDISGVDMTIEVTEDGNQDEFSIKATNLDEENQLQQKYIFHNFDTEAIFNSQGPDAYFYDPEEEIWYSFPEPIAEMIIINAEGNQNRYQRLASEIGEGNSRVIDPEELEDYLEEIEDFTDFEDFDDFGLPEEIDDEEYNDFELPPMEDLAEFEVEITINEINPGFNEEEFHPPEDEVEEFDIPTFNGVDEDDLEILEDEMIREEEGTEMESVLVQGEVKNVSGEHIEMATIKVEFYDEEGELLEEFPAPVEDLEDQQVDEFETIYPGIGQAAAQVESYELTIGFFEDMDIPDF